jgi:hypothetical protein
VEVFDDRSHYSHRMKEGSIVANSKMVYANTISLVVFNGALSCLCFFVCIASAMAMFDVESISKICFILTVRYILLI